MTVHGGCPHGVAHEQAGHERRRNPSHTLDHWLLERPDHRFISAQPNATDRHAVIVQDELARFVLEHGTDHAVCEFALTDDRVVFHCA